MPITIFDGIVIGVVLFSAVLAMIRGFSREILSIASGLARLQRPIICTRSSFPM